MTEFFYSVLRFVLGLGIAGVFILAIFDSTPFFFLPFALDAILIILISRYKEWMLVYVLLAAIGSIIGCLITYIIISKSSEQMLGKLVPKRRLEQIKCRMENKTFWTLLAASMLPPPFPFTPFIFMASCLKYPKRKVVISIFFGRLIRYLGEGLLALFFGRYILKLLDSPILKFIMMLIFVAAFIGTIVSIFKWMKMRPRPSRTVDSAA